MQTHNMYGQTLGRAVNDWTKRAYPEKITLHGLYAILCPLSADHAEDLFREWQSIDDERDWTYLSDEKPTTKELCYNYFRRLCEDDKKLYFSVKDAKSGVVTGIFCITNVNPESGNFRIGEINWTPPMKRTRLSTEALYLIIHYFMDKLKYRRCEWRTNSHNITSINSAERFGFQKEGVLRDKKVSKGCSEDIAVFSITTRDWASLSGALQAWLRKENFDDRGRQIKKLGELRL